MGRTAYRKGSPRGFSFAGAMLVAGVLTVVVLNVWDAAEKKWVGWMGGVTIAHPTVFPYLSALVLFFASLTWVMLEARATLMSTVNPRPQIAWVAVALFLALTALLSFAGMAGGEASEAIRVLNCYLFVGQIQDCKVIDKYGQIFNYVAGVSNAASIAALAYLGLVAFELIRDIRVPDDRPFILRICSRSISEVAMLASTVFVTSTLALYLLFIAAAELKPGVPDAVKRQEVASSKERQSPEKAELDKKKASSEEPQSLKKADLDCKGQSSAASFQCTVTMAPESKRAGAVAPVMAFVAGLSFTGVLFFLFVSAGSALDEKIQRAMESAQVASRDAGRIFSAKTWLEDEGLTEGPKDFIFKGLAVLAPAATGALTFFTGT